MPKNENKLQKTRSVGDWRTGSSCREKNNARTSCKGLDINVVSYKYEGMRQKEKCKGYGSCDPISVLYSIYKPDHMIGLLLPMSLPLFC